MKPVMEYDVQRGIGRIRFAHHTMEIHGTRERCGRVLESLKRDAEDIYQRARQAGESEKDARAKRDRILSEGCFTRAVAFESENPAHQVEARA